MSPRAAAGLALLACGVLLLATTQPWAATVTEPAAGAPRTRGALRGGELVPWLAPVALVVAAAVVAGLAGMRWARPAAVVAALALLVGVTGAVVGTVSGALVEAGVVSAAPTGWLWVAAGAGLLTAAGTVLSSRRQVRTGRPRPRAQDPHGSEAERRRTAADWRDLDEGRDPTAE